MSTRVELVIGEDNKEIEEVENLSNKELCDSIYNEKDPRKELIMLLKYLIKQ